MRKAYQKQKASKKEAETLQLRLDRKELLTMLQENLHSFGVELGRIVAAKMLEDEVRRLCGGRHERGADRRAVRHGAQSGWIVTAGQKVPIVKPRVRARQGSEQRLATYDLMQREDAMPQAVLQRMTRGVSTRDYAGAVDLAREGFGVRRASVSRSFRAASARAVAEFAGRRFEGIRFAVIMIDGIDYAGTMMMVALGIDTDGTKHILGFREGASENAVVCRSLIEELCDRGLCRDQATLFVLDGAKALRKAVSDVWGRLALIQRCQLHKKRNVQAHVPKRHWTEISRRLSEAYGETDADRALKILKNTAALLDRISPHAAASLREGMEDTITVVRLGVPAQLAIHVRSTNIIESSLSTARRVSRNVTRWREGDMRLRWCAVGLCRAQQKFRRVKGYKHMPSLIAALDRQATSGDSLRRTA